MKFRYSQECKPTPAMQLYANARAVRGDSVSQKDIAASIGIRQETVSHWKERYPWFEEWCEGQVAVYRAPILEVLEQIAKEQIRDYRYWEALAIKYGYIKPKPEADDQRTEPIKTVEPHKIVELVQLAKVGSGPV